MLGCASTTNQPKPTEEHPEMTEITATQITETIAALTPKGRETMTAVGNWNGSFFDEGCREHSGIWGECLMNESGHKSAGVINRLRDLGLFDTSLDDESGVWFALTALGVAVAQHLNTTTKENDSMTENTPAPAAKKTAAKKTAAKKTAQPAAKKDRAYEVPKGYAVKWPHGGHDLLGKTDAKVEGPAWWVTCNEHGTLTEAKTAKEAEALGALAQRSKWCKKSHAKTAAKKAAQPAKKTAAKATAAKATEAK